MKLHGGSISNITVIMMKFKKSMNRNIPISAPNNLSLLRDKNNF